MSNGEDQGETLRELIARLIDSGKAYLQAEIRLVRKTIKVRLVEAKFVAIFGGAAALLALAGVVVLVAALGLALARWLGPAGGLAAAGALALIAAGLLARFAVTHFMNWKSR